MFERRNVLTWPNLITVVRLLCIPIFVWLLFARDDRFNAALLLGGLGATDWVDGYLARKLDQTTDLGKILDPTADRLLFLVGIVSLLIDGSVPVWFGIVALTREIAVAAAALVLGALGARRIDVTWLGKCATFLLMFAFPFFLASVAGRGSDPIFEALAWMVGVPGLILSYYTLAQYVPMGRRALAEGRQAGPHSDSAPLIR